MQSEKIGYNKNVHLNIQLCEEALMTNRFAG